MAVARDFPPAAIDQYLAYRFGGRSEKVSAVVPLILLSTDQLDVGLMYERGRLQCLTRGGAIFTAAIFRSSE